MDDNKRIPALDPAGATQTDHLFPGYDPALDKTQRYTLSQLLALGGGGLSQTSIDTLAKLNAIVTDATLIDSAQVLTTLLTGLAAGANTPILATDTVLIALQKLQAQVGAGGGGGLSSADIDTLAELNAIVGDATLLDASQIVSQALTGLVAGANTPILATDTILVAMAKLQEQINNFSGGGVTSLGAGTGIDVDNTVPAVPVVSEALIAEEVFTSALDFSQDRFFATNTLVANTTMSLIPGGRPGTVIVARITGAGFDLNFPANFIVVSGTYDPDATNRVLFMQTSYAEVWVTIAAVATTDTTPPTAPANLNVVEFNDVTPPNAPTNLLINEL